MHHPRALLKRQIYDSISGRARKQHRLSMRKSSTDLYSESILNGFHHIVRMGGGPFGKCAWRGFFIYMLLCVSIFRNQLVLIEKAFEQDVGLNGMIFV